MTLKTLKMLRHLSVEKQTPYEILSPGSISCFSGNAPWDYGPERSGADCNHILGKGPQELPTDLKGAPP